MIGGRTYLLTGATGYVGNLVLDALLEREQDEVVVLIRRFGDRQKVADNLREEAQASGRPLPPAALERIHFAQYESLQAIRDAFPALREHSIDEVVHCAGCVDYYDTVELQLANVDSTQALLELSETSGVARFTYISTAYSSGYVDGVIPERAHPEPDEDPTEYTKSKRRAENLVISSGLPYKILRPSIVIGDSRTGRYNGKRYGLYQQWVGLENLMCDRYHPIIHLVGPEQKLNFIHQDAFRSAFRYAMDHLDDGSIMHITSDRSAAPTMRQLWKQWLRQVAQPREVIFYDRFDDVPLKEVHSRQRAYLIFAAVNLEIASRRWEFETSHLDRFRRDGLGFADATPESIKNCQERFVDSSKKIQSYLDRFASDFAHRTRYAEYEPFSTMLSDALEA